MSDPLVLVVLLGTRADATTDAMMGAARRALGPEATVLADSSEPETDREALAIGDRIHARAVARVTWADSTLTVARLHVHVASSGPDEWADDEIVFLPQDAPAEKGRTVGYTLASMVQRLEAAAPSTEVEAAPEPPPPAKDERPTPPTPSSLSRGDVDLSASAIGALGGAADALGASGALRWWASSHVGLRAAAGARVGSVEQASTTTLFVAGGPSYRISIARPWELGMRADAVLFRHSVTRGSGSSGELTRGRWLGAVALVFEARWSISDRVAIIGGLGAELAFGTTAVNVGGRTVADIPLVRGVGELGARFRF